MLFNFNIEEEIIDTTEVIIDDTMEDNSDEIMDDIVNICDTFIDHIVTVRNIRNNIKRFGITKELLHLVNSDKELNKLLEVELPEYDEENVDDKLNKINLESDNIHSTGGEIKKLYITAKQILTNLINKFMEWAENIYYKIGTTRKYLLGQFNTKFKSNGVNIDYTKSEDKKITGPNFREWLAINKDLEDGIKTIVAISTAKKGGYSSLFTQTGNIAKALKAVNKTLTIDPHKNLISITDVNKPITFTEDTIKNKQWRLTDIILGLKMVESRFKLIVDIRKFANVLKSYKSTEALENITIPLDEMMSQLKILIKCTHLFSIGILDMFKYLVKIIDKIEEQKP